MEKIGTTVGSYAPDFELPGIDKQVHHLARYLEQYQAVAVVFLAHGCPCVQGYIDRLKQIQTEFESQGLTLIGINANDTKKSPEDNFEQMKNFAATHKLNFPYLRDPTQDVASSFGVQKTPEVFLIDNKYVLRYRGSIDDKVESPESVTQAYLRNSIAAVLQGEEVEPSLTEPVGSPLQWRYSS